MTLSQITIDLILSLIHSEMDRENRLAVELKAVLETASSESLSSQYDDGGDLFEMIWYQAGDDQRKRIEIAVKPLVDKSSSPELLLSIEGFIRFANAISRLYPKSQALSEMILVASLNDSFAGLLPNEGTAPTEEQLPLLGYLLQIATQNRSEESANLFQMAGRWIFVAIREDSEKIVSHLATLWLSLGYSIRIDQLIHALHYLRHEFPLTLTVRSESLSSLMLAHFLSTARVLLRNTASFEQVDLLSKELDRRLDSKLLRRMDAGFSWLGCIVLAGKMVPSLVSADQRQTAEEYLISEAHWIGKSIGPNELTQFAASALEHAAELPLSRGDEAFEQGWKQYQPISVISPSCGCVATET
jgi:hypothetical protein